MRKETAIDQFFEYGIYFPTRTLYIDNHEINHDTTKQIIKGLQALDRLPEGEAIKVIINNEGGDVYQAFAIYDAINECRNIIIGKVYGEACSAASIILQACDIRVMMPNSILMLHYGKSGGVVDHPKISRRWSEFAREVDRRMEDIYLSRIREKHPSFTRRQLETKLNFDTILWSNQTVEIGLADFIGEDREN